MEPSNQLRSVQGELVAGRYAAREEIGRGGMGVVFRAFDTQLNRWVALKMLLPEVTHDASLQRRLASEARTASGLNHPGIAIVFDFVEASDASFIVYELVAGRTLRRELATRPFSTVELVDAGIQLTDALAAAHQQGVVHRDLKPENIMVVPDSGCRGRMKILDFGLARHLERPSLEDQRLNATTTIPEITGQGVVAGTVAYMPPEQLKGGQTDARGDIYALGVILYELATGRHPFRGTSVSETIANILTQTASPIVHYIPDAPREVERIIQKCLRKAVGERYQAASDLLTDLRSFRADPTPGEQASMEPKSLMRTFLGAGGAKPYRLWEILHLKACVRCALLVFLGWRFHSARPGMGGLVLFFAVVVCCILQSLLSSVLLYAGAADPANLRAYVQNLAPWLLTFGLANGLIAVLMAALVVQSHTFLAVLLTVLAIALGFTAMVLKPAMDRIAIGLP